MATDEKNEVVIEPSTKVEEPIKQTKPAKQAKPAKASPVVEPKVEFIEWHAMRKNQIPAHHHREILLADFKARKVPMMATVAEFDAALKAYGVSL